MPKGANPARRASYLLTMFTAYEMLKLIQLLREI